MTTAEQLRRAAQIMRERGLARGTFEDDDGHVCVIGACWIAVGAHFEADMYGVKDGRGAQFPHDLMTPVTKAIGSDVISSWSDELGRTTEQAADALERAAAIAEATS